jgi:hypothetical protein
MNVLPLLGGLARNPVVHIICVLVLLVTAQLIPSIVTVTVVPKLVPVMVIESPPAVGAKAGTIALTTDVLACEYIILLLNTVLLDFILISHV